ncbi:MAG: TonB family protein [Candidatus Sulfotelmatobacter sp.]
MFDLRSIIPKTDRAFLADFLRIAPEDPKQRKLMLASLCLLLVALGFVLWRNRDFWFPDEQEAEFDAPIESSPLAKAVPVHPPAPVAKSPLVATPQPRRKQRVAVEANASAPSAQDLPDPPPVTISARTVLPPLDVEVVAGDTHRTIRPGSSSVRVDLQPGTPAESIPAQSIPVQPIDEDGSNEPKETAATLTSDAAERVQMSAVAAEIVARPVKPDYPLLARQMKVQGSVILKALIGRDGIIQNLRVVSGPRILASAAEDAVRQWHFKPHLEGSEAVETEAKITVNFTISTN